MDKAYETYKNTSSSFIKEIPSHWKKFKVKHLVDRNTYYPVGDGDHGSIKPSMYQQEGIPYIRVQNLSWDGTIDISNAVYISEDVQKANKKSNLFPGDILIAKTGATIGKLGLITDEIKEANTTSSVGKLTVDLKYYNPKYILYCFQSKNFNDQIWLEASQKSAQPGFNIDDLIEFEIASPKIQEQTQIASYLDYHTQLIDTIISKKEILIKKLQEQRQAIINEAVTKGLNKNVELKDSGIEWLGEIPEHWEVVKLKYFIDELESGVSVNSESEIVNPNSIDYGILKTSAVFAYDFNPFENKKVIESEIERVKCPVRKDSIIISRMNTPDLVGSLGYVSQDYDNLFLPDRLWQTLIKDKSEIDVEFLSYILKSDLYRKLVSSKASGTSPSMKNITKSDFLESPIPLIPIDEQLEIKEYLLSNDNSINTLLESIKTSIQKLKDYRQSLISEAVTGKIDVREWQHPSA